MKTDSERIDEYLNHLAVEKALAKNTLQAYRRDLSKFQEFLEINALSLDGVDAAVATEFIAWLRGRNSGRAPLAESSIARNVVAIRNFFAFDAKEARRINPMQELRPPKIPKRLPKSLSIDEITRLISHAHSEADPISLRDVALIELLYATGARISEAVGLNLKDVDLSQENEMLSVKLHGKGGKERVVPIGNFARKALQEYLVRIRPGLVEGKRVEALFVNTRGNRLTRQSAWHIIHSVAQRAKLEREVTPHSLRHSFATHLLDGGADIRTVQELLGHASVTTTQIYTLITIDKLRESYASAHPRARS